MRWTGWKQSACRFAPVKIGALPIPRAFRWPLWRTLFALLWLVLQPVVFHRHSLINPTTFLPWDLPGYHAPLENGVVDALRRHQLPLWDPYTYGGYPLHANSQAQILYPPAWPAFAAAALGRQETLFYWMEWETVLHISLAGVLTWWLLRRAGCSRWPALFGATVYQLGCFFTSQVQHLGAVCAAAWLPLVWVAVMELARKFDTRWFAALAAALAMTFLSGFMAMTLVAYGSAMLVAIGLWLARRAPLHLLLWTTLGILASILLMAAQLVPTAMWSVHSQASLRWRWNLIDGIPPKALLSALWPDWFHVFEPERYTERFNLTWMYLYSGQAALWLLLASPWVRTKLPARVFAVLGAVFAVAMFGDFTPGYAWLFRLLPHAVQGAIYPHFALAAFSLAVAICAAFVLEHIAAGRRAGLAAAVALVTCVELLAIGSNRSLNAMQGDWKMVDSPRFYFQQTNILPQLRQWLDATVPPQRTDSLQPDYRFSVVAPAIRIQSLSGDDPLAPRRLLRYRKRFGSGPDWVRTYPVTDPGSPLLFAANVGFLLHYEDVKEAAELRAAGWELLDWKAPVPSRIVRIAWSCGRIFEIRHTWWWRRAGRPDGGRG
jgi:hypothetical protein